MRVAVHARAIDVALDALPSEWLGTTFRNENLLGREAFASALNDLVCGIVESGASEVTTSALEALGVAEDYLRVASNLSVFLELELARVAGHGDVRRVFSFASEDAPRVVRAAVDAGEARYVLPRRREAVGERKDRDAVRVHGENHRRQARRPDLRVPRRRRRRRLRDDGPRGRRRRRRSVRRGVSLRAAAAAGVAGVVDGSDLHVLDQSKLPPEAVATARKRAATPATHALALFKARSVVHWSPYYDPRSRGERRFLKDFSRRISPPRVPRFQSRHTSAPFNSASDAFQLHPDVRSYGPSTLSFAR